MSRHHRAIIIGDDMVLRIPVAEVAARFKAKVQRNQKSGCLEWAGATNKGYGYLTFALKAHQIALLLAGHQIDPSRETLHECDNKACVDEAHLKRDSHAQNMADCRRRGRYARQDGQRNGRAKLTPGVVAKIRREYADGLTQETLASQYGIVQTTISRIVRGERWTSTAL